MSVAAEPEVTEFYDIADAGLAKELIDAGRERSAAVIAERMKLRPVADAVAS